jgi:hypothetical protein
MYFVYILLILFLSIFPRDKLIPLRKDKLLTQPDKGDEPINGKMIRKQLSKEKGIVMKPSDHVLNEACVMP